VKPEISGAEIPINDEAGDLDEEELETLREAGILASSSSSNRRHKVSRKAPRHLVFFENDDEGITVADPVYILHLTHVLCLQHVYTRLQQAT